MRQIKNRLELTLLIISFLVLVFHIQSFAQVGTVYFEPPVTCVSMSDTFQVDIAVDENLLGIHCFWVKVGFDRDLIELFDISEGPLLKDAGDTFFFWKDTSGIYDIFNCIFSPSNGFADGPGVLATMEFVAKANPGITPLHFTYVIFQDTVLDSMTVNYSNGMVICGPEDYRFGDANDDGVIDIGDVVYLINYLYKSGPEPLPLWIVGDVNCDLVVDIGDVVYLINYLYKNGPEPCNPCGKAGI